MIKEIIYLFLWTFVPALELRWSIPWGILNTNLHWSIVFLVCVIANIIVGVIVFLLIDWAVKIAMRIKFLDKAWKGYVARTQKNIHSAVEKYGDYALAIFIGIPLPGTGVYSGALAAYLVGMSWKKFMKGNILGVLIAGVIVLIVTMTGATAFRIFIKA